MKCNAIHFNSLLHLTCFCCFELLSSVAVTAQTVHNCSGARTNEHCVVGCGAGFQGTSVTKTCHSSGNFLGADPTLGGFRT